jgi:hypothetical protein
MRAFQRAIAATVFSMVDDEMFLAMAKSRRMRARATGVVYLLFVFLFLRLGLSFPIGLVVAASLVTAVVMASQLKVLAVRALSVVMYVAEGKLPFSILSSLVVVALIQLMTVMLLRFGSEIGWTVGLAAGLLVAYFVWPSVCRFVRRSGRWCVDNIEHDGRIRFSVRGLLVAITVFAVVLAWLGAEYRRTSQELDVVTSLKELGAEVVYDVKRDGSCVKRDDKAASPSLLRRARGAGGSNVNYVILNLPFARVGARNDKITDECMADIATLTQLRVLDLRGTAITDAGLVRIRELPELEQILITGTHITDAGIREFKGSNPECELYR